MSSDRRADQPDEFPASSKSVATYTNRMGETYYLHEGRTKTGKVRYFVAKSCREGVLSAVPEGWEFSESINGVVSVRKIHSPARRIPESDVALARAELARHTHLRDHHVDVVNGEIVIFEPSGGMPAVLAVEYHTLQ